MSGNHNMRTFNTYNGKWSIYDEAIHRGVNYADVTEKLIADLREDGMTMHAMLKTAYMEGFIHGFEHKFDDTHYEEKKDGNTL